MLAPIFETVKGKLPFRIRLSRTLRAAHDAETGVRPPG